MQKNKAMLFTSVIATFAPEAAVAREPIVSVFTPMAPSVPVEVAMRPPAPSFDTGVPQYQQQQIQQQVQVPPYYGQSYGLGAADQQQAYPQQSMVQRRPAPVKEDPSGADNSIAGKLSGSFGLATDYTFRGISQTQENPAVQGGIEYQHYMGLYAGLWASNVDFNDGDEASTEFNAYGGYRTAVAENLSLDVGALYYFYPGADSDLNYEYWEGFISTEYGIPLGMKAGGFGIDSIPVGVAFYYSPEFFAETGSAYYLKGTAAIPFENGLTLDAHYGYQWIDDNAKFGLEDYADWSIGVAYGFLEGYEAKVQYIDNDVDDNLCTDICDARAVATVSKSF